MDNSRLTELYFYLYFFIGAVIFVWVLFTGILVFFFVLVWPQRKSFWLWCDVFFYFTAIIGLIGFAIQLVSVHANSLEVHISNHIEKQFQMARSVSSDAIHDAEFHLKFDNLSPDQRAEIEKNIE